MSKYKRSYFVNSLAECGELLGFRITPQWHSIVYKNKLIVPEIFLAQILDNGFALHDQI